MVIFDPLLPYVGAFLFVFAIILGLLSTAKIFGDKKNVNIAIAGVFGLFSAMYEPFVTGIQTYLPISGIILIIIFFFVLVKKLFEGKKDAQGKSTSDVLHVGVVVASLLILLGTQWDRVRGFLPASFDPSTVLWIIGLFLVFIIFWIAYAQQHKSTNQPRT